MNTDLQYCQLCPRLNDFRQLQRRQYPDYHNAPVAPLGAASPRLLVVGLAPGLHGANATGIPFCGDSSGRQLHAGLCRHGFARRVAPNATRVDLVATRITNAVKCLPPQNRPSTAEVDTCNRYLRDEIAALASGAAILALGGIAHRAALRALDLSVSRYRFSHLAEYDLPGGLRLFDSYHCSRYNFNTGRLDQDGFDAVFRRLRGWLG